MQKVYKDKPLVSIVVPAYNAENYIRKCIDSVLTQTYRNIELVIVNDGSIDNTREICASYADKDARVHVINKENAGVSAARNSGISEANGNLICFLDADDWLSSNIIQMGVNGFRDGYLNMWGRTEFLPGGLTKHESIVTEVGRGGGGRKLTREELIANAICSMPDEKYALGTYFRAVTGKLFEKSIIDKHIIDFPENLYMGEDAVFLLKYLIHISGVNVVADDGYNYNRMNGSSATTKYHDDLYEQCRIQYEDIVEIITKNSLDGNKIIADSLVNFRWWMVTALMDNAVKGVVNRKLPIRNLTKQSVEWIEQHNTEMKATVINSSYIGKRHQNLYYHREKLNSNALIKYYLLPQVVKKLMKKLKK